MLSKDDGQGHRLFPKPVLRNMTDEEDETKKFVNLIAPISQEMGLLEGRKVKPRSGSMPAGFTYLGQMIAHDLVPPHKSRGFDEMKMRLFTNRLDLKSLYGNGDFHKNKDAFDGGKFVLFESEGVDVDLPRGCKGAIIPDPRNDENVLISQLHLLWLRFHNKVVDNFIDESESDDTKLKVARHIVISVFRTIVRRDFLEHLLDPKVHCFYKSQKSTVLYNDKNNKYSQIPLEFATAGFRFGHSMIREQYTLQKDTDSISIDQLITKDHVSQVLPQHRVDWMELFGYDEPNKPNQPASAIDLTFAPSLGKLEITKEKFAHIVAANFNASNRANLPTGNDAIEYIRYKYPDFASEVELPDFTNSEYAPTDNTPIKLYWKRETKELPLWPYILLEYPSDNQQGKKLGPLGSIVVAEVLFNAMDNSGSNIDDFNEMGNEIISNNLTSLTSMLELIEFVNKPNIDSEDI